MVEWGSEPALPISTPSLSIIVTFLLLKNVLQVRAFQTVGQNSTDSAGSWNRCHETLSRWWPEISSLVYHRNSLAAEEKCTNLDHIFQNIRTSFFFSRYHSGRTQLSCHMPFQQCHFCRSAPKQLRGGLCLGECGAPERTAWVSFGSFSTLASSQQKWCWWKGSSGRLFKLQGVSETRI